MLSSRVWRQIYSSHNSSHDLTRDSIGITLSLLFPPSFGFFHEKEEEEHEPMVATKSEKRKWSEVERELEIQPAEERIRTRSKVQFKLTEDDVPETKRSANERFKEVTVDKHGERVQDIPWIKKKYINDDIGYGVVARRHIPEGRYVLDYPATDSRGHIGLQVYGDRVQDIPSSQNPKIEAYALELYRDKDIVALAHKPKTAEGL
uniref:SET domain-containing protein n=1 Tax=Steinernema glaseri TaxID=37863 RepID=A0A1I8AL63_9BILA